MIGDDDFEKSNGNIYKKNTRWIREKSEQGGAWRLILRLSDTYSLLPTWKIHTSDSYGYSGCTYHDKHWACFYAIWWDVYSGRYVFCLACAIYFPLYVSGKYSAENVSKIRWNKGNGDKIW